MRARALVLCAMLAAGASAQAATWIDVDYVGDGVQGHRLDIRTPNTGSGPFPVLVTVHGGGWIQFYKEIVNCRGFLSQLRANQAGWAIANISYRLASGTQWPGQIHDVKAAIRFVRSQAATYNLDPNRIAISGESAGGQLAAIAGTTNGVSYYEGTLGTHLGTSSDVQAVGAISAILDLDTNQADLQAACGSPGVDYYTPYLGCSPSSCHSTAQAASPYYQITASTVPFWIVHGTADCSAAYVQATKTVTALAAAGVYYEANWVVGGAHTPDVWNSAALQDAFIAFLNAKVP